MSAAQQDFFCRTVHGIKGKTIAAMLAIAAMFGVLSAAACGCSSNPSPAPPSNFSLTAEQVARATVLSAEAAWVQTEKTCKAIAQAKQDDSIRAKCMAVLDQLAPEIDSAAHVVDAWTDAQAGQVACMAADVLGAWPKAVQIIQDAGGTVPPVVDDLVTFASKLAPTCTRPAADAGSASNETTLQTGTRAVGASTESVESAASVMTAITGDVQ